MFDIGWQELFIVAVLVVIVVGPKDLPRTLRAIMGWVRKARMLAREFQDGVDDVVRQADLDDIKKQVTEVGDFELGKEFKDGLDLSGDLDADALKSDIEDALSAVSDTAKKPALVKDAAKKKPRQAKKAARKTPAREKKSAPLVRKAASAKAGKAARSKKAAARRPSRGTRTPTKTGA